VGRLSCAVVAVVHLLSSILALSLDPKEILNDLSPYGEIGLILIIFAETGLLVGFFLPGDSLLFTAGILANQGKLNLAVILVGCFAAAVIGDQVGFTIGQKTGPALLRRPDSRFFKREFIDRTEDFFDQHGAKTIVLARFVPVVRTFAPVVAGIGKMSRKTFISFNVIGGFVWTFGVICGAIWAQQTWGRYWGWDPKETWSFITWVIFAGYLHARATSGWKGTRAAAVALVGFVSLLITGCCLAMATLWLRPRWPSRLPTGSRPRPAAAGSLPWPAA